MDEHTLNDLLECSVCLDRLDTSSKVLPCQHTFCRKCLLVIYASRQELRCPECRVLVDIKIEDLPPNVLLMRILEGIKNAATKQAITTNTDENSDNNRPSYTENTTPSNERSLPPQQQLPQQPKQRQNIPQFQQQNHNFQQQNQLPTTAQTSAQQQQHATNQQRRCIVPHAYALYDFDSNEATDLHFKKGDLILLRRKIDNNWYVGQSKGVEGNFPINYVQVIVPLATSQCVSLYDFRMGPNEEEGCLTFKKGTVIQVLRRVDQNWAEGRIGNSIGIFPIAFVELNQLAKQLLENYPISAAANTNSLQQPMSSAVQQVAEVRNLPPIPVVENTAPTTNDSSLSSSTTGNVATITSTQLSCSSSSNSSATTSPISTTTNPSAASSTTTSSSSTAIFHSVPNSPQSSMPSTPQHAGQITNASNSVRLRNNDLKHKRHSLNALLNNGATALSILQSNRHSAEILSVPNDFETEMNTISTAATGQTTAAREQQHHAMNLPANVQSQNSQSHSIAAFTPTARHNVLKTCVQQNTTISLPWGYLALYPYIPRKNDELELKKGCVYMVTERCLDGWFKGKNWKDVCGVFPGNYVTPLRARDQQQLMHGWKLIPPSNYPTMLATAPSNPIQPLGSAQQAAPSNYSASMRSDLENINARLTLANLTPHPDLPPDLPARQLAISPTTVNAQQETLTTKEHRDKEAQKEKHTTTGCMSTSTTSSNSTSSASAGLKKFLTHIKSRSKSPGSAIAAAVVASSNLATTQMQAATGTSGNTNAASAQPKSQAVKQAQPIGNISTLTPVHVRSGSCPSQLLQNFPQDFSRNSVNENKDITTSAAASPQHSQAGYGSQRIKGPKERASLENTRPTIDSTLRSIYANQLQQSSLMPKKCSQQYQHQMPPPPQQSTNTSFGNPNAAIHRKSHSLDASNILQSSAVMNTASSSSAINVGVGGSGLKTSTPQCNINAAAVHASATTKSTTQTALNESRFRCVVPYPPNSDVELELQVGDIIFVYRKQKNGWYKGTNSRTYKTGLFPASFVEPDL